MKDSEVDTTVRGKQKVLKFAVNEEPEAGQLFTSSIDSKRGNPVDKNERRGKERQQQ